jgi:CBS domain-containing protein
MKTARYLEAPEPLADVLAADVMQRHLVTVQADDSLHEVERVLDDAGVTGVPVLDDDGHMLGVLSVRDLVRRYAEDRDLPEAADYRDFDETSDETGPAAFHPAAPAEPCAADIMTTEITSVGPTAGLREVAAKMIAAEVHRLFVVDHGRVLGIISSTDILRALAGS